MIRMHFDTSRLSPLLTVLLLFGRIVLGDPLLYDDVITESRTRQCLLRQFEYVVSLPPVLSPEGKTLHCSAMVTVESCWGRCESDEIPDYTIPYKLSRHPVCTYDGTSARHVVLSGDDCHPDYPNPIAEVFDAVRCRCKVCTEHNTNCETLND